MWAHSYYMKVRNLREGSSGSVHLAVDLRFGNQVAIKFIPRGSNSVQVVAREVLNQRLCFHHPHIVQFREVFLTAEHLAIVSEYAAGGDLADYIDRHQAKHQQAGLTEANALWLFHQLVTGVNFCHQMGIANRDIKLENTLLMDESERPLLKLCDFGYSKDEYQGSACKTLCGTPEYVAPEVLAQSNYDGKAADVWSCGVVLYTLLTGAFPFRDPQEQGLNPVVLLQRVFPRILAGSFEMPPGLSPDCQSVLKAMLTVDPAQRIPAIQLLQHPWLKKFDAATELAHLQKTSKKPMAENWVMQTDTQILNLSQLAAANPQDAPASPEAALPY